MIKKYHSLILSGYKVTFNPAELDEINGITKEIRTHINRILKKLSHKKKNLDYDIKELIAEYPHIPQFKNYLSVYYSSNRQLDKAFDVNQQIVKEHPDYLFGKINLALFYLGLRQYEKIPEILGEAMEIKSLYPHRDVFHIEEVVSFYSVAINYFLEIEDIKAAEMRVQILKQLDIDHPKTKQAETSVMIFNIKKSYDRFQLLNKTRTPEFISKTKYIQTKDEPSFVNPEIKLLYQNSFQGLDVVTKLLELPRESLIEDLKKVVVDSIVRYKYFKKETEWRFVTHSFLFHALFMLRELKAEEALEIVLDLLRQNEKFLKYWFSDSLTEDLWMIIYALGQNQLEILRNYLFEEGNYTYARTEISQAVIQTALKFPERRNEVLEWYHFVLNYFLGHKYNDRLIDTSLIGLMVCDVVDLKAVELEQTIQKLYEANLVEIGTAGEFENVLMDLHDKNYKGQKRMYPGIEEIYEDFSDWEKSMEKISKEEITQPEYKSLPEEYKSISRNEKCPCGSGLKFKKCHGKGY